MSNIDKRDQSVVRLFLVSILAVLRQQFKGLVFNVSDPARLTIRATVEMIDNVVEYIQEHYAPQIGIHLHSDTEISLFRDKNFTVQGYRIASQETETASPRKRISDGEYLYKPNGYRISKNHSKPCESAHAWIVKDSAGNFIAYSDTLRNSWFYLESNFPS